MKKMIFTILLSFLSLSMFAQWGAMTIGSQDLTVRFWVFVDDVLQNQYSVNTIKIDKMNIQQQYKIRIEMDNPDQNIVGQNITVVPNYRSNIYLIQYRNGVYFFKNANYIINPSVTVTLIVPNYNFYNDYYSYLYPGFGNYGNYWGNSGKQYNYYNNNGTHGNNQGGNHGNNQGGNYGNNQSGNYVNNQGENHGNNQGENHGSNQGENHGNNQGGNHGNNGGQYNGGNNPCMLTNEFNIALNSIRSDSFESGKLTKAKQIVSRNRMCTAQIIEIVRLFSFESNKLEFAKYAYQFCVDKNNYYLVTDAFSFQSSKDELLKFIK
jgi:hypothetical protein